jgi:Family of unknown function (DUF6188)
MTHGPVLLWFCRASCVSVTVHPDWVLHAIPWVLTTDAGTVRPHLTTVVSPIVGDGALHPAGRPKEAACADPAGATSPTTASTTAVAIFARRMTNLRSLRLSKAGRGDDHPIGRGTALADGAAKFEGASSPALAVAERLCTVPTPPYIRSADGTVREGRNVVPGPDWLLGLCDVDLTRLWVDHACSLIFEESRVMIENSFTLHTVDGAEHLLDPGERRSLGPLLAIYPDRLIRASVASDGSLRLDFVSGAWIHVPQDDHYEAWEVSGPGGRLVVCPPAGGPGLAVWT